MARPRSEEKRKAILAAAVQVIAEEGLSATTSQIAKLAGVAEGSLFTYFVNKDDLLNQLYVQLELQLGEIIRVNESLCDSHMDRARRVWWKYVEWGAAQPQERSALAQLSVCRRVTDAARSSNMQAFGEMSELFMERIVNGNLGKPQAEFAFAVVRALADTTIDFIARDPAGVERYCECGFEILCRAFCLG
jgi:AcrR family transcriptional regulator